MAIYVQSRGKNQDQDYRWLRIKTQDYYPENPSFLLDTISNLTVKPIDLIESQKPSIVLVAKPNDYCLLLTGLKSRKERSDFTGRPVRNSILWIYQKDNENLIRSLLIQALRGELDKDIDKYIDISGEHGFEVDYEQLKAFSNEPLAIENHEQINSNRKIGKNCDVLREELALELESNALPNKEGLLVLVTSIKSASALKETGVWRGLSNRVEFEKFEKYTILGTTESEAKKKTIWLWIAIAIIIIGIFITVKLVTSKQPQIDIQPPSKEQKISPPVQQNPSSNLLEQDLNLTEPPLTCQKAKEKNLFLSPCLLNNSNNSELRQKKEN